MKQFKFLATPFVALMALAFLISCGSGKDKTTEATTDTSQAKPADTTAAVTPEPAKPLTVWVAQVKVANYDKWKAGYDAHDSARKANGLSSLQIATGLTDPKEVTVVLKVDDVAKAKAFGSSDDLKTAMQKSGVIGKPKMWLLQTVMDDNSKIDEKRRVVVMHKVKDWDAWKKVYDADKPARDSAGLIERAVARDVDDPNMVTLVFAFSDLAKAKAFSTSKALKEKMTAGGVEGAPTMMWYKIVQEY